MSTLLDKLLPAHKLAQATAADRAASFAAALQAATPAPIPTPEVSELTYATVTHPVLGEVEVGGEYTPSEPARITSTFEYVMTGDPGDPGCPGEFVACSVLLADVDLWPVLHDTVIDELSALALAALEAPQQVEP